MSIELRDFFAAHAAGTLLTEGRSPDEIARAAYDVADALVAERERRLEREALRDDGASMPPAAESAPLWASPPGDFDRTSLLDEPAPMSEREDDPESEVDPSWEDRAFDPRWEREPRWGEGDEPASDRPGLRSTRPPRPQEDKRHRSA